MLSRAEWDRLYDLWLQDAKDHTLYRFLKKQFNICNYERVNTSKGNIYRLWFPNEQSALWFLLRF